MGMDMAVYFGPCVRIPEIAESVMKTVYGCSNGDCENSEGMSERMKFCPICGNPGKSKGVAKESEEVPDWGVFSEEAGLEDGNFLQIDSNGKSFLLFLSEEVGIEFSETGGEDAVEFSPEVMSEWTRIAEEEFAPYAEAFERKYGIKLSLSMKAVSYWL